MVGLRGLAGFAAHVVRLSKSRSSSLNPWSLPAGGPTQLFGQTRGWLRGVKTRFESQRFLTGTFVLVHKRYPGLNADRI